MYRKQKNMIENKRRYVVRIDPENRWVKLSEIMPWDKIEEHYIQHMCEDNGRGAITSRIAFGSICAKETLSLTDGETVQQISENIVLRAKLTCNILWDYKSTRAGRCLTRQ